MSERPNEISKLLISLMKLPGIGERTAEEILYRLIESPSLREELLQSLERVAHLQPCKVCGTYTRENPCAICQDPSRDPLLMVVARPKDVWLFEKTGFHGRYHVLGGLLDPLEGVYAENLFLHTLKNRLLQEEYQEVILALGGTFQAHTTMNFLQEWAQEEGISIPISRLGIGLPMGKHLESLDLDTLREALTHRQPIQ